MYKDDTFLFYVFKIENNWNLTHCGQRMCAVGVKTTFTLYTVR